jgi:hypothetical protein
MEQRSHADVSRTPSRIQATGASAGDCSPSAAEAQCDQLERPEFEVDSGTLAGGTFG